jgi:hypothetical protein
LGKEKNVIYLILVEILTENGGETVGARSLHISEERLLETGALHHEVRVLSAFEIMVDLF